MNTVRLDRSTLEAPRPWPTPPALCSQSLEESQTPLSEAGIVGPHTSVAQFVRQEIQADWLSLLVLDEKREEVPTAATTARTEEMADSTRTRIQERIASWAAQPGQSASPADGRLVGRGFCDAITRENLASAFCMPLNVQRRVSGVLKASEATSGSLLGDPDLNLLLILAAHGATATENSPSTRQSWPEVGQWAILHCTHG